MRKLLIPVMVIAFVGFAASCGGKKKPKTAADIVVSELKDACGCVDAMDIVVGEMLPIAQKYSGDGEMKDPSEEDKKKLEDLGKKLDEIGQRCEKDLNIPKADAEKCSGWGSLDGKMKEFEKMMMGGGVE